jgi:hypothetical protein
VQRYGATDDHGKTRWTAWLRLSRHLAAAFFLADGLEADWDKVGIHVDDPNRRSAKKDFG